MRYYTSQNCRFQLNKSHWMWRYLFTGHSSFLLLLFSYLWYSSRNYSDTDRDIKMQHLTTDCLGFYGIGTLLGFPAKKSIKHGKFMAVSMNNWASVWLRVNAGTHRPIIGPIPKVCSGALNGSAINKCGSDGDRTWGTLEKCPTPQNDQPNLK